MKLVLAFTLLMQFAFSQDGSFGGFDTEFSPESSSGGIVIIDGGVYSLKAGIKLDEIIQGGLSRGYQESVNDYCEEYNSEDSGVGQIGGFDIEMP